MFRDLGLAETQAMDQVADRAWSVTQEFDNLKTMRLSQRFQCFHHGEPNMPHDEYSCQDIFSTKNIRNGGHGAKRSVQHSERCLRPPFLPPQPEYCGGTKYLTGFTTI